MGELKSIELALREGIAVVRVRCLKGGFVKFPVGIFFRLGVCWRKKGLA